MVYMVTNVTISPIFPSITGLLVNIIVSLNNASTGVFLIFKLLYEQANIDLKDPWLENHEFYYSYYAIVYIFIDLALDAPKKPIFRSCSFT